MKKYVAFICIFFLLFTLTSCNFVYEQETGITVANNVLPSCLELTCSFQASTSYATGYIIDDRGYVATNAHVVTEIVGRYDYEALKIIGKFYNSETEYDLSVIDYDLEKDLAILKFIRTDLTLTAVKNGDSTALSYGETIFTIGNAEGYGLSVTKGIISVPRRMFKDSDTEIVKEVIQTDAPINSGSSGGPLINVNSEIVGMISFKVTNNGNEVEGIGFAIPSNIVMDFFNSGFETDEETV